MNRRIVVRAKRGLGFHGWALAAARGHHYRDHLWRIAALALEPEYGR